MTFKSVDATLIERLVERIKLADKMIQRTDEDKLRVILDKAIACAELDRALPASEKPTIRKQVGLKKEMFSKFATIGRCGWLHAKNVFHSLPHPMSTLYEIARLHAADIERLKAEGFLRPALTRREILDWKSASSLFGVSRREKDRSRTRRVVVVGEIPQLSYEGYLDAQRQLGPVFTSLGGKVRLIVAPPDRSGEAYRQLMMSKIGSLVKKLVKNLKRKRKVGPCPRGVRKSSWLAKFEIYMDEFEIHPAHATEERFKEVLDRIDQLDSYEDLRDECMAITGYPSQNPLEELVIGQEQAPLAPVKPELKKRHFSGFDYSESDSASGPTKKKT
jgi:hypothetical protein